MKKVNFVLKFEFVNNAKKVLQANVKLEKPILHPRFIKVNAIQPGSQEFLLTIPLVDDSFFFSNNSHNRKNGIIFIGLSGSRSNQAMMPINPAFAPLREFSIFMFYPTKKDMVNGGSSTWVRANLFIFYEEGDMLMKEMSEKKTFFFLKLDVEDRTQTACSTTFELPKPIYGAREIQVINWSSGGGGFDFVMSPIIEDSFLSNDPDVDMPVIAYGVNGVSRERERMKIQERDSTLRKLHLKMVKTNKAAFPNKFSLVFLVIFHKQMSGVETKVYPDILKASVDVEAFRLQVINNIQNDLKSFIEQDRLVANKAKSKLETLQSVVSWTGAIGTAISGAGGAVSATGVGIIPGGIMLGVGIVLGGTSVVVFKIAKRVEERFIKFDKLVSLGEGKMMTLQENISKALEDEKVSQEELAFINDEMRKFTLQRSDILHPRKKLVKSKTSESKRWSRMEELEQQLNRDIAEFFQKKKAGKALT